MLSNFNKVIRNTDVSWTCLYMHSLCSANHPSNPVASKRLYCFICVSTILMADRSKTNKPVKHLTCIETEIGLLPHDTILSICKIDTDVI